MITEGEGDGGGSVEGGGFRAGRPGSPEARAAAEAWGPRPSGAEWFS